MTLTAPPTTEPARLLDAAEMGAVAAGDPGAFQRLYRAHRERVYRVAFGVLLDGDEARDVVQETFLRLHRAAPSWRPEARISTWLYRVAVNEALGIRRKLRVLAREWRPAVPTRSAEQQVMREQASRVMLEVLRTLPANQRAVVGLFLDAGLAPSEIAPLVGATPNATRVTLHRALGRLRKELLAHGIDAAPLPEEQAWDQEAGHGHA